MKALEWVIKYHDHFIDKVEKDPRLLETYQRILNLYRCEMMDDTDSTLADLLIMDMIIQESKLLKEIARIKKGETNQERE